MDRFLQGVDVAGKTVLLRLDLDLPLEHGKFDTTRLLDGVPTIQYLLDHGAKAITVIAHRGRPEGKKVRTLSLKPLEKILLKAIKMPKGAKFTLKENLRYDVREEKNSAPFAKELAKGHDLFVNDAFAASHREHASIVGIPKLLPSYFGLQFEKELIGLKPLVENIKRPFVVILGGAKLETKLPLIEKFVNKADVILVGGKLALELQSHPVTNRRLIVGKLRKDGKDLAPDTIEQFTRFVAIAKTLMWNGPMGMFEKKDFQQGTRALGRLLSASRAYRVVGGGDTEAALSLLKVRKDYSFISSGGGAMLDYVANGSLPGIEAIKGK